MLEVVQLCEWLAVKVPIIEFAKMTHWSSQKKVTHWSLYFSNLFQNKQCYLLLPPSPNIRHAHIWKFKLYYLWLTISLIIFKLCYLWSNFCFYNKLYYKRNYKLKYILKDRTKLNRALYSRTEGVYSRGLIIGILVLSI